MISVDNNGQTEGIREALLHLYDPTVLAGLPLTTELVDRGGLRSGSGMYDLLLATIERLRPPAEAPSQAHGWRCYQYVQRRYVDCVNHETIAHELGMSSRQAYRLHDEALAKLAAILLASTPEVPSPVVPTSHHEPKRPPTSRRQRHEEHGATSVGLASELAAVGRQPPEGTVDVVEVARSVCETLSRVVARENAQLRLQFPAGLPPIRVNRVCLRQIILNLSLYIVQSAHCDVVRMSGDREGGAIVVTLRGDVVTAGTSTGDAPPSPESEPIFAAARQLAHLQGIALDPIGPGPASFQLRVPIGTVRNVLLIDDNPDMGDLFRRLLPRSSYRLVHCRTGERALQLAHESIPDVVILDVVMPTRDGWELLSVLRTDPQTARVPVVVCSVLPDRDLALSLDAADFIAKPVTRDRLARVLDGLFVTSPSIGSAPGTAPG